LVVSKTGRICVHKGISFFLRWHIWSEAEFRNLVLFEHARLKIAGHV
jgi:hypothetical protein